MDDDQDDYYNSSDDNLSDTLTEESVLYPESDDDPWNNISDERPEDPWEGVEDEWRLPSLFSTSTDDDTF